jgi:O-antigen/teichoic acid export membrane protein
MTMSVAKKAKNVAIVSSAAYIEYIAGFFASVLIARSLGPTLFGSYAFLTWLVGQLVMFSLLGVPIACVKFVGRLVGSNQEAQLDSLVRWLRNLTLATGLGVLLIYAATAKFIPTQELPFDIWFTGAFIVLAASLRAGYRFNLSIAQARERYDVGAIAQVIGAFSYASMVAALLLFEVHLLYYLIAYLATSFIQFLTIALRMPDTENLAIQSNELSPELKQEVKKNLFYGSQYVLVSCFSWGAIEFFLLKKYGSLESVAYFSVALTLARAASELLTGGFASTLAPTLAKLTAPESRPELVRVLSETVALFALLATIISCLAIVALPGFVSLFYGAKYDAALPYICAMMLFTALNSIFSPLSAYQMVNDEESERMRLSVIVAVINIILSWFIIPQYGLAGAVFCFALNLLLYASGGSWLVLRQVKLNVRYKFFLKLFIAALIAVACSAPVALIHVKFAFIPAGFICILMLFTAAILLKTFPQYYFQNALKVYRKLLPASASIDAFVNWLALRYSHPLDQ